jgi:Fe-S-cluster containining protein
MRGTEGGAAPMRCVALAGSVGMAAHCSIYLARPGPCRELGAAWEHGEPSPQCDRARALHGLPTLTPADWVRG